MKITKQDIINSAKRMQDRSILIPTGFEDLDQMNLGLKPGELMIVAARPSMGKTSMSIDFCLNVSKTQSVLFVSAEMSKTQLIQRMITSLAKIDSMKIRVGDLNPEDKKKLNNACTDLETRDIHICDDSCMTVTKIKEEWESAGRPRLVIVDYIQLLYLDHISQSRNEEVSTICRELHGFAKDNDISVVCLCQLNRKNEERPNKIPRMSDLRDSGAIEQVTDSVLFIHRDDYYKDPMEEKNGQALLILAKNRNGPTGSVRVVWIEEYSSFSDLTEEQKDLFLGVENEL